MFVLRLSIRQGRDIRVKTSQHPQLRLPPRTCSLSSPYCSRLLPSDCIFSLRTCHAMEKSGANQIASALGPSSPSDDQLLTAYHPPAADFGSPPLLPASSFRLPGLQLRRPFRAYGWRGRARSTFLLRECPHLTWRRRPRATCPSTKEIDGRDIPREMIQATARLRS